MGHGTWCESSSTSKLYKHRATGRRVAAIFAEVGHVTFYPEGGGWMSDLDEKRFHEEFVALAPEEVDPPLKACLVGADWVQQVEDLREPIKAYANGLLVNGWAQPYFELPEALRLLDAVPCLEYDAERDCFLERPQNRNDPVMEYPAEIVTIDGQEKKVYGIGGTSWCWDFFQ